MARQRKRKRKQPEDEAFTRSDFGRIAGVVLLLVALLMLTTTPKMVIEASHRAGYVETMARVERRSQHRGGMVVTLLSTGEKVYVRHPVPELISPSQVRVLYNPDASALIAFSAFDTPVRIRSFDSRVLAPGPLPTLAQAIGAAMLNLLLGIGALWLIVQPQWRPRSRSASGRAQEVLDKPSSRAARIALASRSATHHPQAQPPWRAAAKGSSPRRFWSPSGRCTFHARPWPTDGRFVPWPGCRRCLPLAVDDGFLRYRS